MAHKPDRPADPRKGLFSAAPAAARVGRRKLAADDAGRDFLRKHLAADDVRVRAAALTALIDAGDRKTDLPAIADKDAETGLRALAVRTLAARGEDVDRFLDRKQPAEVRAEAIAGLSDKDDLPRLLELRRRRRPLPAPRRRVAAGAARRNCSTPSTAVR